MENKIDWELIQKMKELEAKLPEHLRPKQGADFHIEPAIGGHTLKKKGKKIEVGFPNGIDSSIIGRPCK